MDTIVKTADEQVLGIIISTGNRLEKEPRFSAYVWGPGPDADPAPVPEHGPR
jgi:hypothetical protein